MLAVMQFAQMPPLTRVTVAAGLVVVIVIFLAIPLFLLIRAANRRRMRVREHARSAPMVDAWQESARRLEENPKP